MPSPFTQSTGIFMHDGVPDEFISSLLKRLKQAGIDCSKHRITEDTSPAKILGEIKFALVVFSKGYANSNWSLDKLVEILTPKGYPVVIPIFYISRPTVVGNGEFALALQTEDEKERDAKKKEWRSALAEAEEISRSGRRAADEAHSLERKLIDIIVGRLVNKIYSRHDDEFTFGPFGDEGQNGWKSEKTNGKWIIVRYGEFIKSVTFAVDEGTDTSDKESFKVELEDQEYITSFAGSQKKSNAGRVLISSLTFRTNKRILRPIGRVKEEEEVGEEEKEDEGKKDTSKGKSKNRRKEEDEERRKKEEAEKKKKREEREKREEDEYFSVPSDAGKVTEFYWREEGDFLASVAACVRLGREGFDSFPSVGLFGRTCDRKSMWVHKDVRKIHIHIGQKEENPFIRLIKFTCGDQREWKHGSETGLDPKKFLTIILDKYEYLTSISGYYTDHLSGRCNDFGITSLTFGTNKRMAITIGEEGGIYFSSPAMAGKITGFYGYMDEHQNLCGIGAYFERISDCGVRDIYLPDKQNISSFECEYDDGSVKGLKVTSPTGVSCNNIETVNLDYPREYLTSISGYVGKNGNRSISSITFYSNKQRFVFGTKEKDKYYFWYPSTGSRIIGFHESPSFDRIEMQVEPIPHLYPFKTVGPPMKGFGGDPWDDGVHTDVRGFRLTVGELKGSKFLKSITSWYDNNGSLVEGAQHGGQDASTKDTVVIMLDFPKERLLRIKGCMRREKVDEGKFQTIIHDLIIVSTGSSYGPFPPRNAGGKDKTKPKQFIIPGQEENARIIGFFGMAGESHLNSIGVRLEPH